MVEKKEFCGMKQVTLERINIFETYFLKIRKRQLYFAFLAYRQHLCAARSVGPNVHSHVFDKYVSS
jgi:hypothetical protein